MNVLMISGDRHALIKGSSAYDRLELQRSIVDRLDVFVWPQVHSSRDISVSLQTHHYDVVTAQDPFWRGLLAYRIKRSTGAKLNLQVHTDLSAESFMRRALALFLLRRADSVRVVSQKIKEDLLAAHLRVPIKVLPVYINLDPFRSIRHRPHPRFKKTIVWIGRFEPEKDPTRALEILKEVHSAGSDAGLIMLGTGSLERKLRRCAKGLLSYVEFPGWQNPIPYLEMADVVLSTSRFESYGVSVIEALAAGVPVVAPDVGVAKESGAIVVSRSEMALSVTKVLQGGTRGELKVAPLTKTDWVAKWRETLS